MGCSKGQQLKGMEHNTGSSNNAYNNSYLFGDYMTDDGPRDPPYDRDPYDPPTPSEPDDPFR